MALREEKIQHDRIRGTAEIGCRARYSIAGPRRCWSHAWRRADEPKPSVLWPALPIRGATPKRALGPLFPICCVTRPGSAARFHAGSANGRALDDDAFGAAISLLVGHPLAATGRSRVRSSPATA
jgi:hypothetical protein